MVSFLYDEAFIRNFGLLSDEQWQRVRRTRVGIAGLGGCGSNHAMTLVRMGFTKFAIADPDRFEIANFNRQAGANIHTLGQRKTDVMRRMILEVNPEADVSVYSDGINEYTLTDFVGKTDIGINAIDFFRADLYAQYHDSYRRQEKYSTVGAAPFAFGAALTVIGPETPSFNEIFGISATDTPEQILTKFCTRMAPSHFARSYLPEGINQIKTPIEKTEITSSASALQLCTALTAAEILFTVTGIRKPTLAPKVLEFDLLTQGFSLSQ